MKALPKNLFETVTISNQEQLLPDQTETNKREIVFIDSTVADRSSLVAGIKADALVVILDPARDGVEQITESLQATQYNSVHIVSHGSPGCLYLGRSQLSDRTLEKYAEYLQQWFRTEYDEFNSLLLYGCNVASGDGGLQLIAGLHQLTGANIAASANRTGNAGLGGDWNLEVTIGEVTPAIAFNQEVLENYSFVFPSSNDDFANRIILSGVSGSSVGNNTGATGETGEPIQSGTNNSVWWSWTAPSSGTVTFDTFGSNFDTYLSAYTGNSPDSLNLVASNDDSGNSITSRVSFAVTAGTTYHIAVDGYQASTGNISLNYSLNSGSTTTNTAPILTDTTVTLNSVNANASLPSGAVGTLVSSLVGLGRNVTDSNSGAVTGIAIANADTTYGTWYYSTDNGTSWNTLVTVSNTSARLLAADSNTRVYFRPNANYSGNISNALTFRAWDRTTGVNGGIADTTINGASTSFSSTTDTASITVNSVSSTPVNDNFANRIILSGTSGNITGTNVGATGETGESTQSGTNNSVWWSWTAPSSGTVTFDTFGSNFDTYLSAYTGNSPDSLNLITSNDDSGSGNTSWISFAVTAGTTYQIAVDGYQANTGNIILNYTLGNGSTTTNTAPILTDTTVTLNSVNINASFPSGAVGTLISSLVGLGRNVTDSNSGAVTGIAIANADTTNGTWYYSTDNGIGWNTLGTASSTNARLLAADSSTRIYFRPNANYSGNISNAITFRAWDRTSGVNGGAADITINGGSTSFSSATDTASITINNTISVPLNDNFANRRILYYNLGNTTGTNIGATGEIGEPVQSGTTNSVWWSWTAQSNSTATFDTINSNFDTLLSVYTGTSLNNLALVTSNDQIGDGTNVSRVSFAATEGTTYHIAVDGSQGAVGNVSLNYSAYTGTNPSGNRAPTLIDTVVTLNPVNQNADPPSGAVGTLVSSLVGLGRNVSDPDASPATGIAIVGANTTNGSWWYTTNNGTNWYPLLDVSWQTARMLAADANTRIYFQPSPNFTGTINDAITFRAWDQTFAPNGSFAFVAGNGGPNSVSTTTDTASITVNTASNPITSNIAPTLIDTSVTLNPTSEDALSPSGALGTLISSLVGIGRNVTDPNTLAVTGIAIVGANTNNGTWWYSTNNGVNWNNLGTISNISARVLVADTNTRIYFKPNANFNGTINDAITFRAWDQSTGTNGSLVNTTVNGGSSAFSNTTDTASITVNAVNDAPVVTANQVFWVPQNPSNGSLIGTVAATDVDTNTTFSNWTISGGNIDLDGDGNAAVSINRNTGQILLHDIDDLNSQSHPNINLLINVSDGIITSANEKVTVKLRLTPGELDPSFGNDGITTTTSNIYARSVAIQTDGKIVVAGGFTKFDLARYNIDGSLDTNFGNGGKVNTDIGNGSETGNSVTLQPDGKIVVGGYIWDSTRPNYPDFALARYNANGSLDSSFGNGGKIITNFGEDFGHNVVIQPDGKIVLAGYIGNGNPDYVLVRYNTDGSLDSSFGNGGKVNGTNGYTVAIQSDGKILVGGRAPSASFSDFALARYNTNGSLDTGFGDGGRVLAPVGISGEEIRSIALQADGKIVVAGMVWKYVNGTSYNQDDFAIARFNTDGSLDSSFGNAGKVITPISITTSDRATGLTIQPNGKIIAAGYFEQGANRDRISVLLAYNPDGTLDRTFGVGGQVITPIRSDYDETNVVATQSDGKIVLVGLGNGSSDFAVARYMGTLNEIIPGSANTAPTLADTTITLNAVNQNAIAPSGAVGNLVSSLVSLNRNITDPDSGALTGIAITNANSSNGTWWYSTNDGTHWNPLGDVSNVNARLLAADPNTRLHFAPYSNFNGNIDNAITFRAWDRTSGTNGSVADTSTSGGITAFSSMTDIASIRVNPLPTVTLVAIDSAAAETTSNSNRGTYYIGRNQTDGALTVQLDIDASSTAITSDYTFSINTGNVYASPSGVTVVIPNGMAGVNLTLTPVDDTLEEAAETLKLNLASDFSYTISSTNNTGTVTIEASDPNTLPVATNDSYAVIAGDSLTTVARTTALQTSLVMNSELRNWVGAGNSYNFTPSTGNFRASRAYPTNLSSNNAIRVSYDEPVIGGKYWNLSFAAPSNSPLTAGTTYTGATRFPFQASNLPGLDVSGEGRGNNTLTGQFTVNQIIYAADNTIASLDAIFEQRGQNDIGFLRGRIQYNAAINNQFSGVLVNDIDVETPQLTASLVRGTTNGRLVFNPDGSFSYTPNEGFIGTDSFTYQAFDGKANSNTATVTLNVVSPNQAPVNTVPTTVSTLEDTALVFSAANGNQISISDRDALSASVQVRLSATNGFLSLNGATGLNFIAGDGFSDSSMTFTGRIADINAALATLRFDPTRDFNGQASIQITTNDLGSTRGEALTDTDIINITVNPANDLPTSSNKTVSLNEDTVYTFNTSDFSFTDIDTNDTLQQIKITQLPTVGQLFLDSNNDNNQGIGEAIAQNQIIAIADLNKFKFKPAENANGDGYASFNFQVGDGKAFSTSFTMSLNVTPINDAPGLAIGGNQSIRAGAGQQAIANWASGFNPGAANESGQSLQNYIVEVINNSGIFQGTPTINQAGELIYTPVSRINTSTTAQIRVRVKDNGGIANGGVDTSEAQIFTITVNPTENSSITGGSVAETIIGTDAADRINGLDGNDIIKGGLGNDRIFGNNGNDILYGDLETIPAYGVTFSMNDTISGGAGSDRIYGNGGHDKLYGDDGNDFIWGGDGDDEIWGGLGNDMLNGGAGRDAFVLVRGQGTDTIEDFQIGQDVLGYSGGMKYESLLFTQQGSDTLITDKFGNQNVAILKGITASNLNSSHFRRF